MMTVACPRCLLRKASGTDWDATGAFNVNRVGRRRARVRCRVCGYTWSSGLPAALAAASAERGECELPAPAPPDAATRSHGLASRPTQDFTGVGALARRARAWLGPPPPPEEDA